MRTRAALIETAAGEFARHGYAGAALSRISRAAGASTGALTFHFDSKGDLAAAVVEQAVTAGRTVVEEAMTGHATPLRQLTAVVLGLAEKAEGDIAVRCAVRLEREALAEAESWREVWWPVVGRLAEDACRLGELPTTASPSGVVGLAALFIRSIGIHHGPGTGAAHLARLWLMTQPGAAAGPL